MEVDSCKACGKKCSMTDSRLYQSDSANKQRMHHRCILKFRNVPSSNVMKRTIKDTPKDVKAEQSPAKADNDSIRPLATDLMPSGKISTSDLHLGSSANSKASLSEEVNFERNKRKLEKLLNENNHKHESNQFFFDLKAGIAKPHEKRKFLHHKRLQDMKVSYDDNCFKAETSGRSYDHRGKDLDNPSSSSDSSRDSDDDSDKQANSREDLRTHKRSKVENVQRNKTGEFSHNNSKDKSDRLSSKDNGRSRNFRIDTGSDIKPEQQPCWFCLSSPTVEKHLIIAIGDHCYLALAKGGLADDHLLIIPIQHLRSTNDIDSAEVFDEIRMFKTSLVNYFGKQSRAVIFFERNFRSTHLQIQVMPINLDMLDEAETKIKKLSGKIYPPINYMAIPTNCNISDSVPRGEPYFLWEIEPLNQRFCSRIRTKGPFFPMQFGRQILAHKDFLDLPDKVDWKKCAQSDEECKKIVKDIKESYKQFDFTLD